MTIRFMYVGSGENRHRRYFLTSDTGNDIAWFDNLDTAATVMRFMRGCDISKRERVTAHEAMIQFDIPKEGDSE